MKATWKRALSLLLALSMTLGLAVTTAAAEEAETSGKVKLTYGSSEELAASNVVQVDGTYAKVFESEDKAGEGEDGTDITSSGFTAQAFSDAGGLTAVPGTSMIPDEDAEPAEEGTILWSVSPKDSGVKLETVSDGKDGKVKVNVGAKAEATTYTITATYLLDGEQSTSTASFTVARDESVEGKAAGIALTRATGVTILPEVIDKMVVGTTYNYTAALVDAYNDPVEDADGENKKVQLTVSNSNATEAPDGVESAGEDKIYYKIGEGTLALKAGTSALGENPAPGTLKSVTITASYSNDGQPEVNLNTTFSVEVIPFSIVWDKVEVGADGKIAYGNKITETLITSEGAYIVGQETGDPVNGTFEIIDANKGQVLAAQAAPYEIQATFTEEASSKRVATGAIKVTVAPAKVTAVNAGLDNATVEINALSEYNRDLDALKNAFTYSVTNEEGETTAHGLPQQVEVTYSLSADTSSGGGTGTAMLNASWALPQETVWVNTGAEYTFTAEITGDAAGNFDFGEDLTPATAKVTVTPVKLTKIEVNDGQPAFPTGTLTISKADMAAASNFAALEIPTQFKLTYNPENAVPEKATVTADWNFEALQAQANEITSDTEYTLTLDKQTFTGGEDRLTLALDESGSLKLPVEVTVKVTMNALMEDDLLEATMTGVDGDKNPVYGQAFGYSVSYKDDANGENQAQYGAIDLSSIRYSWVDEDGQKHDDLPVDAGTYDLTITVDTAGETKYTGSVTEELTIVQKKLDDTDEVGSIAVTLAQSDYTYDGTPKQPAVTSVVYNAGEGKALTLTPSTDEGATGDYTVSYPSNGDNTNADENTDEDSLKPTVTVTAVEGGNYTGSAVKHFTIKKLGLTSSNTTLVGLADSYPYNGEAQTGKVTGLTVAGVVDGQPSEDDYDVTYKGKDNTESPKNVADSPVTVTVTVKGESTNFTGTVEKTFEITPAKVTGVRIGLEDNVAAVGVGTKLAAKIDTDPAEITGGVAGATYEWSYIAADTAESSSRTADDGKPAEYTITEDDEEGGTIQVKVTLPTSGNFAFDAGVTGVATVKVGAQAINIGWPSGKPSLTYTGAAHTPKVSVTTKSGEPVSESETNGYTVRYDSNVNAGTAYAIVEGTGDYTGSMKLDFEITKANPVLTPSEEAYEIEAGGSVSFDVTTDGKISLSGNPERFSLSATPKNDQTQTVKLTAGNTAGEAETATLVADPGANYNGGTSDEFTVTVKAKQTNNNKDNDDDDRGSSSTPSTGGGATQTGTKTETTTNPDGSTTKTTTNADGSTTTETTAKDGSKTTETTAKDGSTTTETKKADGSTGKVETDARGNTVSAEATVSDKAVADAAASGKAVTVPVEVKAANDSRAAAEIEVTMPRNSGAVTVEVPVTNLTESTVAIIVHADGTEEIVKMSVNGEDGVKLTLDGSATLKIVDNSKYFPDVRPNQWFADTVAWASSHEIMNGMDAGFEPDAAMSRAMLAQMLFNLEGAEAGGHVTDAFADVSPEQWFAESVTWAYENGIAEGSDGLFSVDASITREQMVVMIYRYAQLKGVSTRDRANLSQFTDSGNVAPWAQDAMSWAVGAGIIGGMGDGTVSPGSGATRAQLATIIQRFVRLTMK